MATRVSGRFDRRYIGRDAATAFTAQAMAVLTEGVREAGDRSGVRGVASQYRGWDDGATVHRFGTNPDGAKPRHAPWIDDHGGARQAHVQQHNW